MAETAYNHRIVVDLDKPLCRINAGLVMAAGDNLSNRFSAELKRAGKNVDISGSAVTGYFIRPTGDTVVLTGAAEGNVAYVDLLQNCYSYDGTFSLALKVGSGNETKTLAIYDGRIAQTRTDAIVDPENVIPSLEELLAQIDVIEKATAAAQEAAEAANEFVGLTVQASTLPNGQQATASYANGVLTLGLPRGEKGDTGSASAMKVNGIEGIDDDITITGGDIPRAAGNSQTIAAALTAVENAVADAAAQPGYAVNLLDNSDFLHPVNQRGLTSYAVNGYTIDRWRTWADTVTVELTANGIVTGGTLYQYMKIDPDATYTAAVCRADGSVVCVSGTPRAGMRLNPIAVVVGSNGLVTFTFTAGSYKWAALYRGTYTQSTLPLYVPKGYAAELAECMCYYQDRDVLCIETGWDRYDIGVMINMRIKPTVNLVKFTNSGTGTVTNMSGCHVELDDRYIYYATLPTVADYPLGEGRLQLKLMADL